MITSARELLASCANNIAEASRQLLNEENTQSVNQTSVASVISLPITPSTTPAGTNRNNARIEHQRLFNYQPPKTVSKADPKKGSGKRRAKKARVDSGGSSSSGVWVHKFVCLDKTDHDSAPSVREKIDLQVKGLGEKELVIDKNDKGQEIMEKFYEAFSPLQSSGEVEILRTSSRSGRSLEVIPIPRGGFTVNYLKSVLGQAKGYLRPIQKDLEDCCDTELMGIDESEFSEECLHCHEEIPLSTLRSHVAACKMQSCASSEKTKQESILSYVVNSDDPPDTTASTDNDVAILQTVFPETERSTIVSALTVASGSCDGAANILSQYINSDSENESDDVLPFFEDAFNLHMESTAKEPHKIMDDFRKSLIDDDSPIQVFRVSRMDGVAEMQADILSYYKNPSTRFKAPLKIRFEGEDGVGVGPVREFFVEALSIVEEGFGNPRVLMFEGESDHKVPVHSPQMRQTGAYKAVGKIIKHSILHGGPGLYGLSPAIKHYLCTKDLVLFPPPLQAEDLPYYDLRECIGELANTESEIPEELHNKLLPYLLESGMNLSLLSDCNRELLIQGLLMFFIIDKRVLELNDLIKGMEEVSLHTLLCKENAIVGTVFPNDGERKLVVEMFKDRIEFEDSPNSSKAKEFFLTYLMEISERSKPGAELRDLCCFWTGCDILPPGKLKLSMRFADSCIKFPTAETCFLVMTLPTIHTEYQHFKKDMDNALLYGSRGFVFT